MRLRECLSTCLCLSFAVFTHKPSAIWKSINSMWLFMFISFYGYFGFMVLKLTVCSPLSRRTLIALLYLILLRYDKPLYNSLVQMSKVTPQITALIALFATVRYGARFQLNLCIILLFLQARRLNPLFIFCYSFKNHNLVITSLVVQCFSFNVFLLQP
jgi:hypothetical protein